jgi:TetR/AcrR family transcriptional regulator, transcriptional repressor for nem operon
MARIKEFNEEQALDKAVEIFWHKGYNGTSAQDLVTYLGLSRSSIYDTFGDKHTLFIKALKRYENQAKEEVREMIAKSTDIKETIGQLFKQAILESFQDKITKGCFMVNTTVELAMHDPEIEQMVDKNRQNMEDIFFEAVKKGQDLGQIAKTNDARSLARFIFCNYSGIRVLSRSAGTPKQYYDDIVKVVLSVF